MQLLYRDGRVEAMRLPALLGLSLAAALLAGCLSDGPAPAPAEEPLPEGFDEDVLLGSPSDGAPAGDPAGRGEPRREEGPVETGMTPPLQFPGLFWARQSVAITNGFGGADAASVFVGSDAGPITVVGMRGDAYSVEVLLESYGPTEQSARDALARMEVAHTDLLDGGALRLTTVVKDREAASPLPLVTVGIGDTWSMATVLVTLPEGPAYELDVDASSGSVDVSGLRGPLLSASTSSGDIALTELNAGVLEADASSGSIALDTVRADELSASASSGDVSGTNLLLRAATLDTSTGDIDLEAIVDSLEADASSGSIRLLAHARSSGSYDLSTSSGDIEALLLTGPGRGYRAMAESSSGSVEVRLDGEEAPSAGEEGDDEEAQAETEGFDAAAIQTVVTAEASSGDVVIVGSPRAGMDDDTEDDEDGEGARDPHAGHGHGGSR